MIISYEEALKKGLSQESRFLWVKKPLFDSVIRKGLSQKSPFSWRKTTNMTIS